VTTGGRACELFPNASTSTPRAAASLGHRPTSTLANFCKGVAYRTLRSANVGSSARLFAEYPARKCTSHVEPSTTEGRSVIQSDVGAESKGVRWS
jgi:hypothetical protein